MTVESFVKILQSYKKDSCYNDYLFCITDKEMLYIDSFDMVDNMCYFWLTREERYKTPKSLVAELKKYAWQKDWTVAFEFDGKLYHYESSMKVFNNLEIKLK